MIQNESLQESDSNEITQNLIETKNSSQVQDSQIQNKISFKQTNWRWIQLLLISLYNFSNLYGQQIPAPIQQQLGTQLKINETQYNAIFTGFAFPNIVLPLFASVFSAKIGLKKTIFCYTFLIVIGVFIQWVGVFNNNYTIMMVGVVIFGIGSNGGLVLMNSFTCLWFFGSELSTALAVGNAIQYCGQMWASIIIPNLYDINKNVNYAYFFSFIQMIVLCLIPFFLMCLLDKKAEAYDKKHEIKIKLHEEQPIDIKSIKKIFGFGQLFWYVQTMVIFAYLGLCYNNNINSLLQTNYQVSENDAGYYAAMQFLVQLPLTPLVGFITDKYGKRSQMAIIGGLVNLIQFLMFLLVPICPKGQQKCSTAYFIIPLVLGGIGNSFFGAVFQPMTALTVEKQYVELGFGVLDGITQLAYTVGPLTVGGILNGTKKQNGFFWFFIFCSIVGFLQLLFSFYIYIYDKQHYGIFNLNSQEIQQREEELEYEKEQEKLLRKNTNKNSMAVSELRKQYEDQQQYLM